MIRIYMGKSAAGKDFLQHKDMKTGLKPIISYTTRPMRDGEVNGVAYHFVDREEFETLRLQKKFVESRSYHTLVNNVPDIWYYAAPWVNPDDNWVTVLDLDGAQAFLTAYGSSKIELILVEADEEIRKKRAMSRGGFDEIEWNRRVIADNNDFSEEKIKTLELIYGKKITRIINENS